MRSITATARSTSALLARCLWPGRCAGCDALRRWDDALFCPLCASLAQAPSRRHDPLEGIDSVYARFEYEGVVQRALHAWKYEGREAIGRALSETLAEGLSAAPLLLHDGPWDIVPVPSHPRRLRERGFDQTRLLAMRIAALDSRWRLAPHALRRARYTPRQVGLGREAREANVRGAFAVGRSPRPRVCLVDDVVTTGATVTACAAVLRRQGARAITLLTLARASAPQPLACDAAAAGRPPRRVR